MDVAHEIGAGMSWRRFSVLLRGLSGAAVYRVACGEGGRRQHITGAEASSFFASFPKAEG